MSIFRIGTALMAIFGIGTALMSIFGIGTVLGWWANLCGKI